MSKLMHVVYWLVIVVLGSLLWREYQTESSPADTVSVGAEKAPQTLSTEGLADDSSVGGTSELTVQLAPPSGQAADETESPSTLENGSAETVEVSTEEVADDATAKMLAQLQRAKDYPQRLQREGVDQDWNYQVSSDVERIFSDVTGLDKEHLGGVTCRMTLCEVLVSTQTEAPIDTMMRLQKSLIDMPWYTEDYSTIFDATDKDGFYRIYLERERP